MITAARSKNRLQNLLSGLGSSTVTGLRSAYYSYTVLLHNIELTGSALSAAEKTANASNDRYQEAYAQLMRLLGSYSIDAANLGFAEEELIRIETLSKKLDAAVADYSAAEQGYTALSEKLPGGAAGNMDDISLVGTDDLPHLNEELKYVSGKLDSLTARYNMTLGEIRALGDPVVLGSEKGSCETALAEQNKQYDALTLAIESLRGASAELQTRFSPLLSDTAGKICSRLTGGRYERLTFDKALDAYAKSADESVSRNILSLSTGTADQIYLALRLAVCELILPESEPCPLILDDALSNFDDKRAALALDVLLGLSQHRQILLFTCHGREADYFAENSTVQTIKL
jgi:DNA repair exonuclease SbcCD ATPase subunit